MRVRPLNGLWGTGNDGRVTSWFCRHFQGLAAVGEEVAVPVNDAVQLIQKEGGFFAGAKAKDRQGRKNCPDGPALRSSRRYRLAATVLKVLVRLPPTDEIIAIAATAISAAIRAIFNRGNAPLS